jgi:excinuclease UvrABC helicase subunit UvrB
MSLPNKLKRAIQPIRLELAEHLKELYAAKKLIEAQR